MAATAATAIGAMRRSGAGRKFCAGLMTLTLAALSAHANGGGQIVLASTTSLDNSGLYEYLLPHFEKETGIAVSVIAVGTGRALNIGRMGDADVLIVHDRESELEFIRAGYGVDCKTFMHNEYVIVGPKDNPAGIHPEMTIKQALNIIKQSGVSFISRGDDSGTHKKELFLWDISGITPSARDVWYIESGRGMGGVLNMANEKLAYTLSDYSTWVSFNNKSNLILLLKQKPPMYNPYSIILVSPERYPEANYRDAKRFSDWLTGARGLALIARFKVRNTQLFEPLQGDAQTPCKAER